MNNSNHLIIMAGGVGNRFWPVSTREKPKQFIDVLGCGKSLLQLTVEHFKGICLLCCTQGDSKERILNDIATAKQNFEYFSVNLFCNNSTAVKRDEELVKWFIKEVYPQIKDDDRIEILIDKTDLGVGEI